MKLRSVSTILRSLLSLAAAVLWVVVARSAPPSQHAVCVAIVALVSATIVLVSIRPAVHSDAPEMLATEERLAVWRLTLSVMALVLTALAFPPVSVPLSSPWATAFIAAALLLAAGVAWDVGALARAHLKPGVAPFSRGGPYRSV